MTFSTRSPSASRRCTFSVSPICSRTNCRKRWRWSRARSRQTPRRRTASRCAASSSRNLGRYAEALETQDAILTVRPESAETHYNRGVSLGKLGRHEEAVASYRKSIDLKFGNPQVFHNLGNSLIELGRPQEALDAYEKRLAREPHATDTLINRGKPCLN